MAPVYLIFAYLILSVTPAAYGLQDDAADQLAERLLQPNPSVRETALREINRRDLNQVVAENILDAYPNLNPASRANALVVLARMNQLSELLLSQALQDADEPVRTNALLIAGQTRGGSAIAEALSINLADPSPYLRVLALEALSQQGTLGFSQLERMLNDPHWLVRERAVNALQHLPDSNELRELILLVQGFALPQKGWRFQTDPKGEGEHNSWYSEGFNDEAWQKVSIEKAWGTFGHDHYIGDAWYRRTFTVPEILRQVEHLELYFQGVDESAWVWLNGEYIGKHDIGPVGWDMPFSLDLADHLDFSRPNQLSIRVRNTSGAGGIWQPAWVRPKRD